MRKGKVSIVYLPVMRRISRSGPQCLGEEGRGYVLAKLNYRDFPLIAVHHHHVTLIPAQVVLKFH